MRAQQAGKAGRRRAKQRFDGVLSPRVAVPDLSHAVDAFPGEVEAVRQRHAAVTPPPLLPDGGRG